MRLGTVGLIVLLPLLSFLSACRAVQGYGGERRPEHELALVDIYSDAVASHIWLDRVDGQPVNLGGGDEVETLPGNRRLEGRAHGFGQNFKGTPFQIDFLARAGWEYSLVLTQPTRSDRMDITVLNRKTGESEASITIWP